MIKKPGVIINLENESNDKLLYPVTTTRAVTRENGETMEDVAIASVRHKTYENENISVDIPDSTKKLIELEKEVREARNGELDLYTNLKRIEDKVPEINDNDKSINTLWSSKQTYDEIVNAFKNIKGNAFNKIDVLESEWVLEEGMYKVRVNHTLYTEDILPPYVFNTLSKKSMSVSTQIINDRTIEIIDTEPSNITITIVSSNIPLSDNGVVLDDELLSKLSVWSSHKTTEEIEKSVENLSIIENNVLKNELRINDIESELVESTNRIYNTINGICEFESKNGYATNFKMKGKTLVNVVSSNVIINDTHILKYLNHSRSFTTGTVVNNSDKEIFIDIHKNGGWVGEIPISPNTSIYINLTDGKYVDYIGGMVSNGWTHSEADNFKQSCLILLGDHTNDKITYFEGLKSVGQGDKIEVLNHPNNSNLFDKNRVEIKKSIHQNTGEKYDNEATNLIKIEIEKIDGVILTKFNISSQDIFYYRKDNTYLGYTNNLTQIDTKLFKDASYIYVRLNMSDGLDKLYIGNKFDKKQVSTTLRSIHTLTDELEGNRKIERCGEYVFNGIENWEKNETENDFCLNFVLKKSNIPVKYATTLVCNMFKHLGAWNTGIENIHTDPTGIWVIEIAKSRLKTPDVAGFKEWLKTNNVRVVYELATPRIIELPIFDPMTFEGNNTLLINSGVVQPDAEFEITNNLRSEMDVLKEKTTSVEEGLLNNVYGYQRHELTMKNGAGIDISNLDLNDIRLSGFYSGWGLKNCPTRSGVNVIVQQYWGTHYISQLMIGVEINDYMFYRIMVEGVWQPWQKITTSTTISLLEQQISDLELQLMEREFSPNCNLDINPEQTEFINKWKYRFDENGCTQEHIQRLYNMNKISEDEFEQITGSIPDEKIIPLDNEITLLNEKILSMEKENSVIKKELEDIKNGLREILSESQIEVLKI